MNVYDYETKELIADCPAVERLSCSTQSLGKY